MCSFQGIKALFFALFTEEKKKEKQHRSPSCADEL